MEHGMNADPWAPSDLRVCTWGASQGTETSGVLSPPPLDCLKQCRSGEGGPPGPHRPLCMPGLALCALLDLLETLSDIDEMSRRRPEILGFFSVSRARTAAGPGRTWVGASGGMPC